MYIGQLARRTGASAKAIRHYEALGLLGPVTRAGSYRVYDAAAVDQVALIRQALALGFRLAELVPLVAPAGGPDWPALARQVDARRAAVQQEIARLKAQDRALAAIGDEIRQCLAGRPDPAGACATGDGQGASAPLPPA